MKIRSDFLVVGSGIAGLCYALTVAERDQVALITKRDISTTATRLAQGGIAAVSNIDDSFEQHIKDTMEAGAWLPDDEIVRMVVENGPKAIEDLIKWGVNFSRKEDQSYDLTREGGHSQRRIYHSKDETGKEIERALVEAVQAHPNITIYENHVAVDLITEAKVTRRRLKPDRCLGVYALNRELGQVGTFEAPITILATGGAGKVYLYTCNPDIATGDGIAMAYRAGATIANMEFMQFHPTVLYIAGSSRSLITEAIRGEGAYLVDRRGYRFMFDYDERGELAPRDVLSRSIMRHLARTDVQGVFLDLKHVRQLRPDERRNNTGEHGHWSDRDIQTAEPDRFE